MFSDLKGLVPINLVSSNFENEVKGHINSNDY